MYTSAGTEEAEWEFEKALGLHPIPMPVSTPGDEPDDSDPPDDTRAPASTNESTGADQGPDPATDELRGSFSLLLVLLRKLLLVLLALLVLLGYCC